MRGAAASRRAGPSSGPGDPRASGGAERSPSHSPPAGPLPAAGASRRPRPSLPPLPVPLPDSSASSAPALQVTGSCICQSSLSRLIVSPPPAGRAVSRVRAPLRHFLSLAERHGNCSPPAALRAAGASWDTILRRGPGREGTGWRPRCAQTALPRPAVRPHPVRNPSIPPPAAQPQRCKNRTFISRSVCAVRRGAEGRGAMPTRCTEQRTAPGGQRWSFTASVWGATIPPSPARSGPASPRVAAGAQHRAREVCGPGGWVYKKPRGRGEYQNRYQNPCRAAGSDANPGPHRVPDASPESGGSPSLCPPAAQRALAEPERGCGRARAEQPGKDWAKRGGTAGGGVGDCGTGRGGRGAGCGAAGDGGGGASVPSPGAPEAAGTERLREGVEPREAVGAGGGRGGGDEAPGGRRGHAGGGGRPWSSSSTRCSSRPS